MNTVRIRNRKKNLFDLTHDVKASMEFGFLYPTMAVECLPDDYFTIGCEALARFAPMVAPVMHRFDHTTHYWFVPNRLLWDNWDDFITHSVAPPATQPAPPYLVVNGDGSNYTTLLDHMGIPKPLATQVANEVVNALPFAAYQLIWSEFYRDQNLVTNPVPAKLVDGNNTNNEWRNIRKRAWEHDYFTSCLPTPQFGTESAMDLNSKIVIDSDTGSGTNQTWAVAGTGEATAGVLNEDITGTGSGELYTTFNTEDIRRMSAIQRFFERLMVTGRRLSEVIMSAFGVKAQDSRLQRPEYITGSKSPIVISEVLNTSSTATEPQGNMSGHGIGMTSGKYGSYHVKEHGWIIAITSFMPKTAYQNGIFRSLLPANSYLDYFWPEFANLGEEAVQFREIFAYSGSGTGTFGYLPRYSRYRTMPSRVAGDFRDTLDHWHFGRQFTVASPPALNQEFIECTPGKRIFAVEDPNVDSLWVHILHKVMVSRQVPKFGTPTLQ